MLGNIDEQEAPDYGDAIFIGLVVNNNDPDKAGRVQCKVKGLFEADSDSDLPWILPAISQGFGFLESSATFGYLQGIPEVGTSVYIELQQGDPHHPVYTGTRLRKGRLPAQLVVNYPKRRGFVDAAGNVMYIDVTSGQAVVSFTHKSGTSITIADNGDVNVNGVNNITYEAANTLQLRGQKVKVFASQKYVLDLGGYATMMTLSGSNVHTDSYTIGATGSGSSHAFSPPESPTP